MCPNVIVLGLQESEDSPDGGALLDLLLQGNEDSPVGGAFLNPFMQENEDSPGDMKPAARRIFDYLQIVGLEVVAVRRIFDYLQIVGPSESG